MCGLYLVVQDYHCCIISNSAAIFVVDVINEGSCKIYDVLYKFPITFQNEQFHKSKFLP